MSFLFAAGLAMFFSSLTDVTYFVHLSGGEELQKVVQETRVIIDQLAPFTNYSFYIRAYNARSKSRPSSVVSRHTKEDGQLPTVI